MRRDGFAVSRFGVLQIRTRRIAPQQSSTQSGDRRKQVFGKAITATRQRQSSEDKASSAEVLNRSAIVYASGSSLADDAYQNPKDYGNSHEDEAHNS